MINSKLLKKCRLEKEMTCKELSIQTGIAASTISRWENGKSTNIRTDNIEKLAQALDVKPSDLITTAGTPVYVKTKFKELTEVALRATDDDISMAISLLKDRITICRENMLEDIASISWLNPETINYIKNKLGKDCFVHVEYENNKTVGFGVISLIEIATKEKTYQVAFIDVLEMQESKYANAIVDALFQLAKENKAQLLIWPKKYDESIKKSEKFNIVSPASLDLQSIML